MFNRITIIIVLKLQKSYSIEREEFALQSGPIGVFRSHWLTPVKFKKDDTVCLRKGDVIPSS
jgi:hypothetical protein